MADTPDSPRKFYQLKPKEFETVNDHAQPAPFETGSMPPPDPGPCVADTGKINVQDLCRQANFPAADKSARRPQPAENDVHAMLRHNAAKAQASGVNDLAPLPPRRSRRLQDYIVTLAVGYGLIAGAIAVSGLNPISVGFGLGGAIILTIAVTWIIWFVFDKY